MFVLLENLVQIYWIGIMNFRYEDLLNNPKDVLKDLLNFLELGWENNLLNYFSFSHDLLIENNDINTNPLKSFLKDRIGSWKKTFFN